jgi:hypothetical protein
MGIGGFTGEIVGVVRHTSHLTLDYAPVEEVYTPYFQTPISGTMTLTIRTASAPLALSRPVRELILAHDKDQPVSKDSHHGGHYGVSVAAPIVPCCWHCSDWGPCCSVVLEFTVSCPTPLASARANSASASRLALILHRYSER